MSASHGPRSTNEGSGALLDVGGKRGRRIEGRPDVPEEAPQERLRVVCRAVAPPFDPLPRERVCARRCRARLRRRRLDHGQRAHLLRDRGRCKQRDHTAVGVADEVGAAAEPLRDENGVALEVDPVDRRWREPGPLEDVEQIGVAERALAAPGRASAHHAAVDEQDPRPLLTHVTNLVVFG